MTEPNVSPLRDLASAGVQARDEGRAANKCSKLLGFNPCGGLARSHRAAARLAKIEREDEDRRGAAGGDLVQRLPVKVTELLAAKRARERGGSGE